MIKYEVGKQFPTSNQAKGMEVCRSETNSNFFDILYYIKEPTGSDIQIWKKGKLRYGVYVTADIPFFIVDFPASNWNFDVNTNIFKVKEDQRDTWLNSEANMISLFLIDADTNTLEAIRIISIEKNIAELYRDALEEQENTYNNAEEVDNKMRSILELITTEKMMQRCKIINL